MELGSIFKRKKARKVAETRLGVASFILALFTLAYFNVFLMTKSSLGAFSNMFLQIIPAIGLLLAFLSFFRVHYKKTFTWWALFVYVFIGISLVTILFVEFIIYPKP
ncbi:hypothetical protein [Sediminibacillus sp. JSM 1682029]|uniref:hypothetical protein n=1 Tax=Sediminibacillus sp. JSM 1682029 TaxID=3229857 RepID=UPI0035257EE8